MKTKIIKSILLTAIYLWVGVIPSSAKEGKVKYGNFVYVGQVENKAPSGTGNLFLRWSKTPVLTGNFSGTEVKNATMQFADWKYEGYVQYIPTEDKKATTLIRYNLKDGKISLSDGILKNSKLFLNSNEYFLVGSQKIAHKGTEESNHYEFDDDEWKVYSLYEERAAESVIKEHSVDTLYGSLHLKSHLFIYGEVHRQNGEILTIKDRAQDTWKLQGKSGDYSITKGWGKGRSVISIYRTLSDPQCTIDARCFVDSGKEIYDGMIDFKNGVNYIGTFELSEDGKFSYRNGTETKGNVKDVWKNGENFSEKEKARIIAEKKRQEEIEQRKSTEADSVIMSRWKCHEILFYGKFKGTEEGDKAWRSFWGIDHTYFDGEVFLGLQKNGTATLIVTSGPSQVAINAGRGRSMQVMSFCEKEFTKKCEGRWWIANDRIYFEGMPEDWSLTINKGGQTIECLMRGMLASTLKIKQKW